MVSHVILDIDGTILHPLSYIGTIGSFTLVFLGIICFFLKKYSLGISLMFISLVVFSYFPIISKESFDAIAFLKKNKIPLFVSTCRPWPFVMPKLIYQLQIPFTKYYFRSDWDKPQSKVKNLMSILKKYNLKKSEMVLVDNELENIEGVKKRGFQALHTPNGINIAVLKKKLDYLSTEKF